MFLKKLFNKKENKQVQEKIIEIYSPFDGTIIELSEVPDEAFAQKMLGDGVAIIPKGNIISAICDAEEIGIFDTKHAITFESQGVELIVHFGIDTVQLDGKGFEQLSDTGIKVKKGENLIKVDLEFIKENAKSIITPVIISNMDDVEILEKTKGDIKSGELLMKVKIK